MPKLNSHFATALIFQRAGFKVSNTHDVVSVNEAADSIKKRNEAAEHLKTADKRLS